MIKGIVAVDSFDAIGFENQLLFKSKEDMNHFVETTTNHIVVMGKNTFISLKSKPLKNRYNIVLSSSLKNEDFDYDNLIICHSKKELLKLIAKLDREDERDIFIMGGSQMYSLMEEYIDEWIVTVFDKEAPQADAFLEVDFQPFELNKSLKKQISLEATVHYYERSE